MYQKRQLNLATVLLRIDFSTHHPHITQRLSKQLLKILLWGRTKQDWQCLSILYSKYGSKIVTYISNRLSAFDRITDRGRGSTLVSPYSLVAINRISSAYTLHLTQNTFDLSNGLVTLRLYEFLGFYASKVKKVNVFGDFQLLEYTSASWLCLDIRTATNFCQQPSFTIIFSYHRFIGIKIPDVQFILWGLWYFCGFLTVDIKFTP